MIIRKAEVGEDKVIAAVHVASWQAAYRGQLPDDLLDNLSIGPRARWWSRVISGVVGATVIVCEIDGHIAGFACFGPSQDEDATKQTGEIQAIYFIRESWGKGYGRALMQSAIDQLQTKGFSSIFLWVLDSNQRAIQFYEKMGFLKDDNREKLEKIGGKEIREIRYKLKLG